MISTARDRAFLRVGDLLASLHRHFGKAATRGQFYALFFWPAVAAVTLVSAVAAWFVPDSEFIARKVAALASIAVDAEVVRALIESLPFWVFLPTVLLSLAGVMADRWREGVGHLAFLIVTHVGEKALDLAEWFLRHRLSGAAVGTALAMLLAASIVSEIHAREDAVTDAHLVASCIEAGQELLEATPLYATPGKESPGLRRLRALVTALTERRSPLSRHVLAMEFALAELIGAPRREGDMGSDYAAEPVSDMDVEYRGAAARLEAVRLTARSRFHLRRAGDACSNANEVTAALHAAEAAALLVPSAASPGSADDELSRMVRSTRGGVDVCLFVQHSTRLRLLVSGSEAWAEAYTDATAAADAARSAFLRASAGAEPCSVAAYRSLNNVVHLDTRMLSVNIWARHQASLHGVPFGGGNGDGVAQALRRNLEKLRTCTPRAELAITGLATAAQAEGELTGWGVARAAAATEPGVREAQLTESVAAARRASSLLSAAFTLSPTLADEIDATPFCIFAASPDARAAFMQQATPDGRPTRVSEQMAAVLERC